MKKQLLLLMMTLLSITLVEAGGNAYRERAAENQNFAQYDIKKSRLCSVMRAANCKTPAGLQSYVSKGCINDLDSESKCLVTFCKANCASLQGCPDAGSNTEAMCNQHCKTVNLSNEPAQNRLNDCVKGSLSFEQASAKAGNRSYYRASLKEEGRGQRAGQREAQGVLDTVRRLSDARAQLLYVDGGVAGIVTINEFYKNVVGAIKLTNQMNNAVASLERSRQSPEIVAKCRSLIANSDKQVKAFIFAIDRLQRGAEKLAAAASAGNPSPSPRLSRSDSSSLVDSGVESEAAQEATEAQ